MARLKNARHERFAQAVADGKTIIESYTYAGYSGGNGSAGNLRARPEVQQRVSELLADQFQSATTAGAARIATSRQWVMEQLRELVDRCMQSKPVLDVTGKPSGNYTFNASGARGALELLGRELGMFADQRNVQVTHNLNRMTRDQLGAMLAELDAKLIDVTPGSPAALPPVDQT